MVDITGQIEAGLAENRNREEEPKEELHTNQQNSNESNPEEQTSNTQNEVQEQNNQQQETEAQKSWRELAAQAEDGKRARQELGEAYRLMRMMQQQQMNPSQNQQQQYQQQNFDEEIDFNSLRDDEFSDNKTLKKIIHQQNKQLQKLEQNWKNSNKQSYQQIVETRIRSEYPDFQSIVSSENVEKLRQKKPYIFNSISANQDLYEQAVGAYDAIKEFGIAKPTVPDRKQMQFNDNQGKPRASATIGTQERSSVMDDIGKYNYPTEEQKEALRRDMYEKQGRTRAYNQ